MMAKVNAVFTIGASETIFKFAPAGVDGDIAIVAEVQLWSKVWNVNENPPFPFIFFRLFRNAVVPVLSFETNIR